jgi:translation initiation factor IF-2
MGGPGGSGAPGGYRPGPRPGGGFNRPGGPGQGGNRPGGSFGYNRNNAPPPAKEAFGDNKKTTVAKKFFKAKKDKEFLKKKQDKEKLEEKRLVEYKKKAAAMANPIPKEIHIMEVITVSDLARKMNLKASDLIGKLMSLGMMVSINQQIDADTASILAEEFGCKVNIVSLYDETLIESVKDRDEDMMQRPPIVTVMGHVDHGKTKLLDAIRQTDVVAGEFGGITQHIGAYMVRTHKGDITFLDTPGHSAFTRMRSRGAQLTDIVVLVVAASEGIMPQTVEAINHAREAKVPIIVALNKTDLPDSNPDRVMQQLSDYDLMPEEWGGKTQVIKISALKRTGIDALLDAILLESEMLELKANWSCKAEGKVVESQVDQGRGVVSTILIQRGTLSIGDSFVAGIFAGKVRAMFNDKGQKIDTATPSMPVEILGFTGGIPNSGDPFQVTENEKVARQYGLKRQELKKVEEAKNVKKITLANLYDSIQDGDMKELKVIIKGDVHGSVEALESALEKLSTAEIRLSCIHSAAGAIVENDISLASASNAIVIGFHVRPTPKAQALAEKEKVEIRKYNIIYDAVEDIKGAMEGMLSPDITEEVIGKVEIRDLFKAPKVGMIAGCMVTEGKVTRKSFVNIIREGVVVFTGRISSLKRFKDDAKDVAAGFECGLTIENCSDIKVGDVLEIFEKKEVSKKLGAPVTNG